MAKVPNQLLQLLNISHETKTVPPIDGEILYCKNNVCIHPPSLLSNSVIHHPGFLSISAKVTDQCVSLMLDWKPSKSETGKDSDQIDCGSVTTELESNSSHSSNESTATSEYKPAESPDTLTSFSDIEPDCNEEDLVKVSEASDHDNLNCDTVNLQASKSPLVIHNFQFPENSVQFQQDVPSFHGHVIRPPKDQAFGAFSVNLASMRSLRLYFRNDGCTSGEMVIASKEAQYKVLHFHGGGLDCVAAVLKEWKASVKHGKATPSDISIHHFSIIKPQLTANERHPEEGLYHGLNLDMWSLCKDEFGRIQNEQNIKTAVFFGGVVKALRSEVWPFLLKYFPFGATIVELDNIRMEKYHKYIAINCERESLMESSETTEFLKNVACSVEKDVLRTDRANPFYQGEDNPNLQTLQVILLNYSAYTKTGYTQGMSDLLSPLLIEIQDESDVFWCFLGLMQRTIFISSPSDSDMEKQLLYLRELLRLLIPDFYGHLLSCGPGALELLFAHRWILLCFKREFCEAEALAIWEACWAHYQTNYFHLFVSVAIIALYGTDVTENNLASDEMLLHFSHLAMQMNGAIVLRKARGLLHKLCTFSYVPCTLHDLFCVSHVSNSQRPKIRCAGIKVCEDGCKYGCEIEQNSIKKFSLKKLFH